MLASSDEACGSVPLIIAAGGRLGGNRSENSIEALEAAIDAGFDMVSLDVRRSRDGSFVIFRDETLPRMTTARGRTRDLSAAFLTRLPLRKGDGGADVPLGRGYVPLLSEALAVARDRIGLVLNLDDRGDAGLLAVELAALNMHRQVCLRMAVRDLRDAARLVTLGESHGVPVVAVIDADCEDLALTLDFLCETGPAAADLRFRSVRALKQAQARLGAAGVAVWTSTVPSLSAPGFGDRRAAVDPDAVWGVLIETCGIAAIESGCPDALALWRLRRAAA